MHSDYKLKSKLQGYAPRVCGIGQHANNTRRRRVSGWVLKKSQKGAWPQKPVKQAKAARACFRRFFAAPTPSAALAHHLGEHPPNVARASQRCRLPQNAKLTHQLGKLSHARRAPTSLAKFPQIRRVLHHKFTRHYSYYRDNLASSQRTICASSYYFNSKATSSASACAPLP